MGFFGPNINKLKKEQDIAGLVTLVRQGSGGTRNKALKALELTLYGWVASYWSVDDGEAVGGERISVAPGDLASLVEGVADVNGPGRVVFAMFLEQAARLGNGQAAVEAGALPALMGLLDSPDSGLRESAARAFGFFATGGEAEAVRQAGAVPWLIHLLQDEDAGVRGSSAEGLGRLCAMEAIPKLELLLQNEEDSVAKVIVKGVLKNLKIY